MALSLNAEQKSVKSIFLNEEQYIIPSFQRPYSWEYEQCLQLYTDLTSAYRENRDYFVGNIILAKGDDSPSRLYLVDGQQRLITLWLILKVLYTLYPEMRILGKLVSIEAWEGEDSEKKIISEIFENDDDGILLEIHRSQMLDAWMGSYVNKSGGVDENKCGDRIIANYLWLYIWFRDYQQRSAERCKDFIKFLLERVYLLPIELTGSTIDDACGKALTIFETINNRGMNLADADIFKARLYNKAALIHQSDDFIQCWIDFKTECDRQGYGIDEIFRFYSHIIRGKEGISGSEKNLRDFFLNEDFSPLHGSYVEFMDSLMKILELLDYLSEMTVSDSRVAPWLQVLGAYTNQYPKYAVLNYLYVNGYGDENEENFPMLKSIRFGNSGESALSTSFKFSGAPFVLSNLPSLEEVIMSGQAFFSTNSVRFVNLPMLKTLYFGSQAFFGSSNAELTMVNLGTEYYPVDNQKTEMTVALSAFNSQVSVYLQGNVSSSRSNL